MAQISLQHASSHLGQMTGRVSAKIRQGLQWWAEHQAWPAIDEIRIDAPAPAKKAPTQRQSLLRF